MHKFGLKIIIATLFSLCLFSMCQKSVSPTTEKSRAVFILVDLSESTNKPEIRKRYIDTVNEIVQKLDFGDSIGIAAITEHSIYEPSTIAIHDFELPKITSDNDLIVMQQKKKSMEEFKNKKEEIIQTVKARLADDSRKILKTDVMSSLQIAEKYFDGKSGAKKYLLILSDMIEDSDRYNFEKENLTDNRIKAIIEKEKKENRIPSLKDVDVWIIGPEAKDLKRYYAIQDFWLAYFKEAGIDLPKSHYGALAVQIK